MDKEKIADIFRSYDIRGIYPTQLNEEIAEMIAQTFLRFLSKKLNKSIKNLHLAVARDIREASEPLIKKVIEIFLKYGVKIDNLDLISINDFYFAIGFYKYDGGLMATASHNPPEYGGFKLVMFNHETESIEFIRGKNFYQELLETTFPLDEEKVQGEIKKKKILEDHLKHVFSFIDIKKIKPFKIVVDTGNGMMGVSIGRIFEKLPCQLIPMFAEYDSKFSNRSPNPLDKGAHEKISKKILLERADFGVMYDVDGDRMFLLDEKGNFIRGDMTLLLLAKSMLEKNPGKGIVYNLICSHAVPELIAKWGGVPIRSEVGYMNLARHMREEDGIMSGEVSGHFAFKNNFYADSGLIALLLALQTISEDGRKLSEIIKDYNLYAKGDEINVEVENILEKLEIIRNNFKDNIKDELDGITVEFDDWWFNVRPSNTEPLLRITVEARNNEELVKHQKEILAILDIKPKTE